MVNFILGTIFGIVVSTIGFTGVAQIADKGVQKVQEVTRESTK